MISIGNSVRGAKIGVKHSFYEKVTQLGEYLVEKGDQGVAEARAAQSILDGFITGKAAKEAKPEDRAKVMTEQFRREKHAQRAASHLESLGITGDKPITHNVLVQTKVRCGFYINEDGEIVDFPVEPQPISQPDEVKQAPQPEVKQAAPPPPKPKAKPQPKVVNDPIVNNPPPPKPKAQNPVQSPRPMRVKGSTAIHQPQQQFDADEFAAEFMND